MLNHNLWLQLPLFCLFESAYVCVYLNATFFGFLLANIIYFFSADGGVVPISDCFSSELYP